MSALKGIAFASMLIALHSRAALASGPPKLDITTTCTSAVQLGRDRKGCLDDEHSAESTLTHTWLKYRTNEKAQCIGIVKEGGLASYVELLSCLEALHDAREFRGDKDHSLIQADQPN